MWAIYLFLNGEKSPKNHNFFWCFLLKNQLFIYFSKLPNFATQKKEKEKKKTPIITHNEQIIRNI
jgi:hypothetical protein